MGLGFGTRLEYTLSKNLIAESGRMSKKPNARDLLEGYRRFNEWELEELNTYLPKMTIEDSLTQFFESCELARTLAPNSERTFLEENEAHWIAQRRRLQRAAKVMGHAKATRRIARGQRISRSA